MGATTGPHRGEAVYCESRFIDQKKQPNGRIAAIVWEDGERQIVVDYYTNGPQDGDQESYSFDSMQWCRLFGGRWLID